MKKVLRVLGITAAGAMICIIGIPVVTAGIFLLSIAYSMTSVFLLACAESILRGGDLSISHIGRYFLPNGPSIRHFTPQFWAVIITFFMYGVWSVWIKLKEFRYELFWAQLLIRREKEVMK